MTTVASGSGSVAAAELTEEAPPTPTSTSSSVASSSPQAKGCRALLSSTALQWYSRAKDYVPGFARPAVEKLEAQVTRKAQQVLSSEAVGVVRDKAETLRQRIGQRIDWARKGADKCKGQWRYPSRSEIHASAVALANMVDELVDRKLPDIADPELTAAPATEKKETETEAGEEAGTSSETGKSDRTDQSLVEQECQGATLESSTEVQEDNGSTADDRVVPAPSSEASIAQMARNIAGKVSFRMKKRVVRQLENAKGKFKLRTQKLLHSTNLIQYARNLAADERYAKASTVLTEAVNVAQTTRNAVVKTIAETATNANITGVELFNRGEETARFAILTTGKITAKCRAYAVELADRIRARIKEMENQRRKVENRSINTTAANDAEEKAAAEGLKDIFAQYAHATAATGAATLFVFRDDLNQILTHAFATANNNAAIASARTKLKEGVMAPAWTAITRWEQFASDRRAAVQSAIKNIAQQGASVIKQATSWTNLAMSEFANTSKVTGSHALPAGFTAALHFILRRMAQPLKPEEKVTEQPAAKQSNTSNANIETAPIVTPVRQTNADVSIDGVVVDPTEACDGHQAADLTSAETVVVEPIEAEPTMVEVVDTTSELPVYDLDPDQSNADWYYSEDGIDTDASDASTNEAMEQVTSQLNDEDDGGPM